MFSHYETLKIKDFVVSVNAVDCSCSSAQDLLLGYSLGKKSVNGAEQTLVSKAEAERSTPGLMIIFVVAQ